MLTADMGRNSSTRASSGASSRASASRRRSCPCTAGCPTRTRPRRRRSPRCCPASWSPPAASASCASSFYVFGVELLARTRGDARTSAGIAAFTVIFAAMLAVNQDNLKRQARLLDHQPDGLRRARTGVAGRRRAHRRARAHRQPRVHEGHAVPVRGLFIKRRGHPPRERDGRGREAHPDHRWRPSPSPHSA